MLHSVYIVQCQVNGKCYVGKSNNPKARLTDHKRRASKGIVTDFLDAIRFHGRENFDVFVIETHELEIDAYNAETELVIYLRAMGAELYNMNDGGKGVTNPSTATRAKIAAGNRKFYEDNPKARELLSEAHKGHKTSDETKKKLSERGKDRIASPETLVKLGAAKKRLWSDLDRRKNHCKHLAGKSRSKQDIEKMRAGWARRRSEKQKQREESSNGNAEKC